jgi:hypothetical protein
METIFHHLLPSCNHHNRIFNRRLIASCMFQQCLNGLLKASLPKDISIFLTAGAAGAALLGKHFLVKIGKLKWLWVKMKIWGTPDLSLYCLVSTIQ